MINTVPQEVRADLQLKLLSEFLKANDTVAAMGIMLQENAYDGKDSQYVSGKSYR